MLLNLYCKALRRTGHQTHTQIQTIIILSKTEDDKAWDCRASLRFIQTQCLPVDPHWSQHPRPARGAVETNYE